MATGSCDPVSRRPCDSIAKYVNKNLINKTSLAREKVLFKFQTKFLAKFLFLSGKIKSTEPSLTLRDGETTKKINFPFLRGGGLGAERKIVQKRCFVSSLEAP